MLLGVATVVVALVWALAGGRGLDPRVPVVRWLPVAVLGIAGQTAIARLALQGEDLVAAEVLTLAALLAACLVNTHLPGITALTAGVVANATVVLANAGMPVSLDAVRAIDGAVASVPVAGAHHVLDAATRLPVLADTLPLAWFGRVVSPGDALLVVGGILFLSACLVGDVVATSSPLTEDRAATPRGPVWGRDVPVLFAAVSGQRREAYHSNVVANPSSRVVHGFHPRSSAARRPDNAE